MGISNPNLVGHFLRNNKMTHPAPVGIYSFFILNFLFFFSLQNADVVPDLAIEITYKTNIFIK